MTKEIFIKEVTARYSSLIPQLFPEVRDVKTTPALFAAFNSHDRNSNPEILGFAILASPLPIEPPDYKFSLHVLKTKRGDGVGDALLRFIISEAQNLFAPSLINLQPVIRVAQHQLLKKYNFSQVRKTITYEFNLEQAYNIFHDAILQLKEKERIPDNVIVSPYDESESHDISKLCLEEFGALTTGHLVSLGTYPAGKADHSFSRSFRLNEELLGAWGVGVEDGVALFDPLLIARSKRNTWVFAFVIYSVLSGLLTAGITLGRALVHADNKKIVAIMKRIGAASSNEISLYKLNLAPDSGAIREKM